MQRIPKALLVGLNCPARSRSVPGYRFSFTFSHGNHAAHPLPAAALESERSSMPRVPFVGNQATASQLHQGVPRGAWEKHGKPHHSLIFIGHSVDRQHKEYAR